MVGQAAIQSGSTPIYRQTVEKLARLSVLPQNWDSYGSKPISNQAVEGILRILGLAVATGLPAPTITPVSGGGLQVEWDARERELEIEVLPGGEIAFLLTRGDETVEEGVPQTHDDSVVSQLLAAVA